eukprot:Hpha_TRINITY_DN16258_c4_g2::TRINITY_DN16258_c4_g2_i1::g.15246::m.15246
MAEAAPPGESARSANARAELKKQLWADAEDDEMDFDDLGELQKLGQALQVSPPSSPHYRRPPSPQALPPPPPIARAGRPAGRGQGICIPEMATCTPAARGGYSAQHREAPGAPHRYPNKLLQCLELPEPSMPGESLWATSANQEPPQPQQESTWGDAQWCVAVALSNTAGFALSRTALQEKLRWDQHFAPSLGAFGSFLHRNNRLFKYDGKYVHFSSYLYQMRAEHDAAQLTPTPGPASSVGTPPQVERAPVAVPPPALPAAGVPPAPAPEAAVSTPPRVGVEVDLSRCVAVPETGKVKVPGRIRLRKQARATCCRYTGEIACGEEVELVLKRRDKGGNEFSLCVNSCGAQGFVRTKYLEIVPHKIFADTQKLAESILAATQSRLPSQ